MGNCNCFKKRENQIQEAPQSNQHSDAAIQRRKDQEEEQRANEEIEENRRREQQIAQQDFDKAHEDLMKAFDELDSHLERVVKNNNEARLRELEQQEEE